jgi:hypothetical protein
MRALTNSQGGRYIGTWDEPRTGDTRDRSETIAPARGVFLSMIVGAVGWLALAGLLLAVF